MEDYLTDALMRSKPEPKKALSPNADVVRAIEDLSEEMRGIRRDCRKIRWNIWVIGIILGLTLGGGIQFLEALIASLSHN